MENQDENFLEVRLDHTGVAYLNKLTVTTRWIFILSMLFVLLVIIRTIMRNVGHHPPPERYISNFPLYLVERFSNWYYLFYIVFFVWQLVCYLKFIREANKAAETLDSAQFNRSFKALCRSNILALIHLPVSMGMVALDIWVYYNIAQIATHR